MRLTIRKAEEIDNWYVIERAEHDGRGWFENGQHSTRYMTSARFSDADVEGPGADMLDVAAAIRRRGTASCRRCAVRIDGDRVFFASPRNSSTEGECTLAEADDLATQIEALLGDKKA